MGGTLWARTGNRRQRVRAEGRRIRIRHMEAFENLRSVAEIAVALLGFTGIVAMLGRRSGGDWTPLELLQLQLLLESSIGVLALCLLPGLFLSLSPQLSIFWRVANGLQAAGHLLGFLGYERRVRRLDLAEWPEYEKKLARLLVPASIALIAAQLLNASGSLVGRGFFLYFAGVLYLLALAIVHFLVLLVPHRA